MRALLVLLLLAGTASAGTEDDWLVALTDRVAGDLADGKRLVAEVHVPLCDNSIIRCGNSRLGDGNSTATNLYWATTPGFGRWFARAGGGWKRVEKTTDTGDDDILEKHVYRRRVRAPAAWRARGVPAHYEVDVVVFAWRGTAIDRALARYAAAMSSDTAHLVAWVGHNRLMDVDTFEWPKPAEHTVGTIAIACHTAAYMEEHVPAPTRVPLLMTRDFLFANAAPFEAAVLAFAAGGDYTKIRRAAAAAYAKVQNRPVAKITGAFTNPADRRWKRR